GSESEDSIRAAAYSESHIHKSLLNALYAFTLSRERRALQHGFKTRLACKPAVREIRRCCGCRRCRRASGRLNRFVVFARKYLADSLRIHIRLRAYTRLI